MNAIQESTYDYFARSDVVSEYASFDFLLEPEEKILEELRPTLEGSRMLDIGVGAGRTTIHFAPLVREYVGIDVSPIMIDTCRKRFARTPFNVSFQVADVRDLAGFHPDSFDFVLFSFNGIDTVGGKDERLASIDEIHRVCRPGAVFCFSSSNLQYALNRSSITASLWMLIRSHAKVCLQQPGQFRKVIDDARRWKRLNPALRTLAALGEGVIVEERPRYELSKRFYAMPNERIRVEKYYIEPRRQLEQLKDTGFLDVRMYDPGGRECAPSGGGISQWWWLYYLCVKLAK